MTTKVRLRRHPKNRNAFIASVSLPMLVGDVPGTHRVTCCAPSRAQALGAAAALAHRVALDPTVGAVIPDETYDDLESLQYLSHAAQQGASTAKAAGHVTGRNKLARVLAREARRYGIDELAVGDVGGLFDDIESLASKAAAGVSAAVDPDQWPDWMKKIAKPLAKPALDAAATAVLGPAGPAAVEATMAIVDRAQTGDPDAAASIQAIAKQALDGNKKAKVLMSAARLAATNPIVGDAADDYEMQYGPALDALQQYGDDAYGQDPREMQYEQEMQQEASEAYDDAAYAQQYGGGYQSYPDNSYGGPMYQPAGYGYPPYAGPYGQDYYPPYSSEPYPQDASGGYYTPDGGYVDPTGQYYPAGSFDPNNPPGGDQQPTVTTVNDHRGGAAGASQGGRTVAIKNFRGTAYGSGARDNRGGTKAQQAANQARQSALNAAAGGGLFNRVPRPGGGGSGGGNDHRSH